MYLDVTGTQNPAPTTAYVMKQQRSTMQLDGWNTRSCTSNRVAYETATFNDATCTWDVTEHKNQHQQQRVKQQRSTMLMYWDVTGTQDPPANRVL
jgi:hypothetical protein